MTANHPDPDTESGVPAVDHGSVLRYEIRVKGRLAPHWSAWFDGLELEPARDGTTVIRGQIVDQAALYGLLQKLRDVGIPLLSLTEIQHNTTSEL